MFSYPLFRDLERLKLTSLGLSAGLTVSLGTGRFLRALLFGVSPNDPLSFGGVTLLIVMVAAAASYLPARRAMKVPPVIGLRTD